MMSPWLTQQRYLYKLSKVKSRMLSKNKLKLQILIKWVKKPTHMHICKYYLYYHCKEGSFVGIHLLKSQFFNCKSFPDSLPIRNSEPRPVFQAWKLLNRPRLSSRPWGQGMGVKSPNPLLKHTKQPLWYITSFAELPVAIIHDVRTGNTE